MKRDMKRQDEGAGRLTGFPPLADADCRIVMLGSMPGEASLRLGRYYGHPRNQFWPLLYALLEGGTPPEAYEARVAFALSRGVALWDVLGACEREGSLDTAIRQPEANDFAGFFAAYPRIRHVFFNGQAAQTLYRKQVGALPGDEARTYTALASSSPARAMALDSKLGLWQPLREAWLAEGGAR